MNGHLLLPIDGTDRRMDDQPLHRPYSTYYAGSVNYNYFLDRQSETGGRTDALPLHRPSCFA